MAELAREEIDVLSAALDEQGERLKVMLLPKDPLDERNIMLEVGGKQLGTRRLQWVGVGWKEDRPQLLRVGFCSRAGM